jgi:TatD DNase family protein
MSPNSKNTAASGNSAPLLIDIGANLTHESFAHDIDAMLERARVAGVAQIVVTGASEQGSRDALALAARYPDFLHATAGLHPHHASDYTGDTDALFRELLTDPRVLAVGETGLDYFRDLSPRDVQIFAFEKQLEIAVDCGKPLFLHQRDAHEDFIACMRNVRDRTGAVVVHCFTGEKKELFDYLDRDWHIGITGWICDERRGQHLRDLVKHIPANRLMIETDSPYLLPRTLTPKPSHRRNEPAFLAHIVEEIARDRGEAVAVTAANSTATARTFFGL